MASFPHPPSPYPSMPHDLVCHPDAPPRFPCTIQVWAMPLPDGGLALDYHIQADPDHLRIPEPAVPARVDGLWQHTCCELFLAETRAGPYREFNFSPSGQWQAYAFTAYRKGGPMPTSTAPELTLTRDDQGLTLAVILPAALLLPGPALILSLTTVLEDRDGHITYWALAHPPGKPDFHHPATFALPLALSPPRP